MSFCRIDSDVLLHINNTQGYQDFMLTPMAIVLFKRFLIVLLCNVITG